MTRSSRLDDPSVIGIEAVAVAAGTNIANGLDQALAMLITAGIGAAIGTAV